MEIDNDTQQQTPLQIPTQDQSFKDNVLNQRGNVPIIIAGIVLLFVVGAGAYYLGTQKNQQTSQTQTTPTFPTSTIPTTSQIIPTSTPASSLTNWKTKSTKLLSLKYPSDWEESQDKATGGYTLIKPIGSNTVWIGINDGTDINQSDTPEQLAKQALGNETPVSKKQITVDGHTAVYQERHYQNSVRIEVYVGEVKEMTEFLPQDGGPRLTTGTHSIFMEIRDLTQLETSRRTFNQILSTFKYSR